MNRKRLSLFVFSLVILMGLGVACKDKPPQQAGYCTSTGLCETVMEAKDYFAFKVGSWWLYEEETTHERDSVYVFQYSNNSNDPNFDCRVISSRSGYTYHYYTQYSGGNGCSYTSLSTNKCIAVRRSKYKINDFVGDEICFFIQFRTGDNIAISNYPIMNNRLHVIDVMSSFNLGSLQLSKTVQFYEDHTLIEHNSPTNHYFSKGIGLVRRELLDSNQVWNLVDYFIEA